MTRAGRIPAVAIFLIASCTTGEPGAIDIEVAPLDGSPARVVNEVAGVPMSTSPTGDVMVVVIASDAPAGQSMCAIETTTGVERFCIDDARVMTSGAIFDWADDGSEAVYTNPANSDVFVVDMQSGAVENLTDDGAVDNTPEALGTVPIDAFAAFSPSRERVVFHRLESDMSGRLMLYDRGEGAIVGDVTLPSIDNGFGPRSIVPALVAPLVVDEGRALVGGADAIFEVDFDQATVTEVFDYATLFQPNVDAAGLSSSRVLTPVESFDDGRLILFDTGVISALNNTGAGRGDYSSGLYLGEAAQDRLLPFLATGSQDEGWLGPMAAISAGRGQYVVSWFDVSDMDSSNRSTHVLSLLDIARDELPVDPNTLPELWRGSDEHPTFGGYPWGYGGKITVGASAILVAQTSDGRALVLELSRG